MRSRALPFSLAAALGACSVDGPALPVAEIDASVLFASEACVPETDREICARLDKTCGTNSDTDNCGNWRTVDDCSFGVGCAPPQICGACHRCCTPETDAEFCARLGLACGTTLQQDNCGNLRETTSCGTCPAPQICNSFNVCCTPEADSGTCADAS